MSAYDPTPRRRFRFGAVLLIVITIPLALVTLLGLEPLPLLPDTVNQGALRISRLLLEVVSVTAAFAVFLGVLNLLRVHLGDIRRRGRGLFSIFTVLTFLLIIVLRILERANVLQVEGTTAPLVTLTLMDAIQVAVESALAGLLFFFLVYSAYRLMRRRVTFWSVLFIVAALVVLVGYLPLPGLEFISTFRDWLLRVPVAAGTRGLLIGVAIGTVVVAVRVLIGQDRTFRE